MEKPQETEFVKRVPRDTANGVVDDYHFKAVGEARSAELVTLVPGARAAEFYAALAHSLTVLARATIFSPEEFNDGQARVRLGCINEIMHGLASQTGAAVRREAGYAPADLCGLMFSKARDGGFEHEFDAGVMSPTLWRFLISDD